MRIFEMGRKLSEEEVKGVKRVESYLDGGVDYAMLSENVFVILTESKAANTEDVKKEVEEIIDEVLSSHPDFETFWMKDGRMLLSMGGIGAFDRVSMSENEYDEGLLRFTRSMGLRAELLDACERAEIIAAVEILDNNESEE